MPRVGEFHAYNQIGRAIDLQEDARIGDAKPVMISDEALAPLLSDGEEVIGLDEELGDFLLVEEYDATWKNGKIVLDESSRRLVPDDGK